MNGRATQEYDTTTKEQETEHDTTQELCTNILLALRGPKIVKYNFPMSTAHIRV